MIHHFHLLPRNLPLTPSQAHTPSPRTFESTFSPSLLLFGGVIPTFPPPPSHFLPKLELREFVFSTQVRRCWSSAFGRIFSQQQSELLSHSREFFPRNSFPQKQVLRSGRKLVGNRNSTALVEVFMDRDEKG